MINLIQICNQCGKEFKVRGKRVYCSKACQIDSTRKQKLKITCQICGKVFEVPPCHSDMQFCSRKCKGINKRNVKDPSMRQCFMCKEIKNINDFHSAGRGLKMYFCKTCGSKRNKKRMRTGKGRFIFGRSIAKRRNHEWAIEEKDYYDLIKQKCHYCQSDLNETGVGLDRKDNKRGYSLDNVVPCCRLCNVTRQDNFSYEEMFVLAESIKRILNTRISNDS